MREAFVCLWDGTRWQPYTNNPENLEFDLVPAPWPEGVSDTDLPTPRFKLGVRIRFKWGSGYLTGTIIEIRTYIKPDEYLRGQVVYEMKEIGHLRILYDDGTQDIEVLQNYV